MSANVNRFLGGSPATVLVKLIFLSLLVGAVMTLLGITPGLFLQRALDAARAIFDLGFDAFHEVGRWVLAGAVIVVPIWLLIRVLGAGR